MKGNRQLDIGVPPRPTFKDIQYLLKDGKLDEYMKEKNRRLAEWRLARYRVCRECGKKKIRVFFDGDSKYCKQCKTAKRKRSNQNRREYLKAYKNTEDGTILNSAKQVVYHLKKMGLIVKKPCEECGSEKSYAHHKDYNLPWKVNWLCIKHHNKWHKHHEPKRVQK